jgi:pentatricopeptide repeat protein
LFVKDAQLYNTMIAAYMEVGDVERAEDLFKTMPERNAYTLVEMVGGYCAHCAMISGYAKSGKADDARAVFDAMKERDVATWNVMIGVY